MTTSPRSTASTPSPPLTWRAFPASSSPRPTPSRFRARSAFRTGYGMQGVNVVARPLDANGNPLYQYTVTASPAQLQRQSRQPRHRLYRRERQPARDVGIERSGPAGLVRPERNSAAARASRPPPTRSPSRPSIRSTSSKTRSAPIRTARSAPSGTLNADRASDPRRGQHADSHRHRRRLRQRAAINDAIGSEAAAAPLARRAACGADA